jgi:hypothetical protein
MTVPDAADDAGPADAGDDAACWQQARRLRRDHPGWVIIWLAPARQYRAYKRLPGARRDTALAAATPQALATAISRAQNRIPQARDQRGPQ